MINIYNANTETEQVKVLQDLNDLLDQVDFTQGKRIVFGGDFNLFFDDTCDAKGGKPSLKQKSIAKLIKIFEIYDLCDIWRIRNSKKKVFTFRQHQFSGLIQRRLDYFFISNEIQELVNETKILPALYTDHSPVLISISEKSELIKGPGLWKFNNSLVSDQNYVLQLKCHIAKLLAELDNDESFDDQTKWEFLKYEIRNFTIKFCKAHKKIEKEKIQNLEKTLNTLENKLDNPLNQKLYNDCKTELEFIYNKIAEGIRVRSKCAWYEEGEKSSKFFLNLEKYNATKTQIKKLLVNDSEITEQNKILHEIKNYFENLFQKKNLNSQEKCDNFLSRLHTTRLDNNQVVNCDEDIKESELHEALIGMGNNKSPGNDGLTKEFYETFWEEIKDSFLKSVKVSKEKKCLSVSQRQAVIKLIEKKEKDKRFIENWRPISLLNVDYKMISKVLASRMKETLSHLVTFHQTAYVKNRFIGESGRLISDILEMTEKLNLEGFIVAMDLEKAFDSVSHLFLISSLKRFGFGKNFIDWIQILINKQESCVLNAGTTTSYFQLCRGTRQGDPISPYLFILVLEILFIIIKSNKKIKGIEIFDHCYLYTAYADDTTFFLKDKESIKELIKMFALFSNFSGLKPNFSKCEIAGIGVLKSVKVAVCGMKCVDLTKETLKIVGVNFSYNKL